MNLSEHGQYTYSVKDTTIAVYSVAFGQIGCKPALLKWITSTQGCS